MKSLSLAKPHLIVVVGLPGSGKSFFADKFSETFHAPFISHNILTASLVEAGDDPQVAAKKSDALGGTQLDELLKTRVTILYEPLLTTRTTRRELVKKAKAAGYSTLFVWPQIDIATAKRRSVSAKRPNHERLTIAEFNDRSGAFKPLDEKESPIVISGKHTYSTQAKSVLKHLAQPRTDTEKSSVDIPPRQSTRRTNITIG